MIWDDLDHPRPDFDRLIDLADQVVATLKVGVHDEDQRMLLIGEARDLLERIQATLVEIEQADPTWPGWAVIEPPLGTIIRGAQQAGCPGRSGRSPNLAAPHRPGSPSPDG